LELKELKKQQVEDSLLREAEVFGLNHKFAVNADERDIAHPSASPKFQHLVDRQEMKKDKFTIP